MKKNLDLGPGPPKDTKFFLNILSKALSLSSPSLMIYGSKYIQKCTLHCFSILIRTLELSKFIEYENLNICRDEHNFSTK